jgi:hypothetical protein
MTIALVEILPSKISALKKEIPAARKAMRTEMKRLYGKIADSHRRRAANSWSRPTNASLS